MRLWKQNIQSKMNVRHQNKGKNHPFFQDRLNLISEWLRCTRLELNIIIILLVILIYRLRILSIYQGFYNIFKRQSIGNQIQMCALHDLLNNVILTL